MSCCIPWDSSITPDIRHTKKPAALQKDRIRPLLALGNGAHCVGRSGTLCVTHTHSSSVPWLNQWQPALCPPWAMLGVGSALNNIREQTTQLRSQLLHSWCKAEWTLSLGKRRKRAPKSSLGRITLRRSLAVYGLFFCSCCRTLCDLWGTHTEEMSNAD